MDLTAVTAGCGAVSALGNGLAPILDAVRENRCGLRPDPRGRAPNGADRIAGWIPESVESGLAIAGNGAEDARAFRLAGEAMRQVANAPLWSQCPTSRRGLVLATTKGDLPAFERLHRGDACSPQARRHALPALLAADLAAAWGIGGPVRCVSVACISGLLALQQANRLIQRGACDAVMVVGVDLLSHFVLTGFTALQSLDPEGCRPFDRGRVGLSVGEAGAAILLAREDWVDGPAWRIGGWGSSNDANHLTGPSRDGSGLALAMERALQVAAVPASAVGYLHAHGTGTPYNDAMEAQALQRVFGESTPPFSSSKGVFGHTLGAAGILETVLCFVALEHDLLPGTPRLFDPDPVVPATVLKEARRERCAACFMKVNCGFGGTNAALVLSRAKLEAGNPTRFRCP